MGLLANATVDIGANLSPLRQGLSSAKTMLMGFSSGMGGGINVPFNIALGITGGGIAGAIAGLGEIAVKASKSIEAMNKLKVTFGPEAGGLLANVDDLASKFGILKSVAADTQAQFGLLGRAAGMSMTQQVSFAKEFTQLAVDLASFHFTSHTEAVQKLMSGLEGMPRPLREFGIFLSEEKVKLEAASLGLAKHRGELTEEEKILARISIIRRESGVASGDAERSLNRNFEQVKKFWGDIENSVTSFGKDLQGALSEGIKAARALGKVFQSEFGVRFGEKVGGDLKLGAEWVKATADAFRQMRQGSKEPPKGPIDMLDKLFDRVYEEKVREFGGLGPIKTDIDVFWDNYQRQMDNTLDSIKASQAREFQPTLDRIRSGMEKVGVFRGNPKEAIPAVPQLFNFLRDFTSPMGALRAGLRGEGPQFEALRAGLAPLAKGRPLTDEEEMEKDLIESHNKEIRQNRIRKRLGLEVPRSTQEFGDPEEYGREMVKSALEGDKGQVDKEILSTIKDNQSNLSEDGRQIIQTLKSFGQGLGIIPR